MNPKALYNLTYGVYFLSAKDREKDNACIINTALQVANNPTRISISAIKGNLTHDMILATGKFNLSPITSDAEFSLFQRFGMQSGRSVDKFDGFYDVNRSKNGLLYLTKHSNAYLSLEVTQSFDLGSHTLFIAEITGGDVLNDAESCTYSYYQTTIKAQASSSQEKSKGWKCSVCNYIYEGENLPKDFICPICKHNAEVFEKITENKQEKKYVCSVCGYVHTGDAPPKSCPVCHVGADKFKEQ